MSVVIACVGQHYEQFLELEEQDALLVKERKVPLVNMCFDSAEICGIMEMFPESEEGLYLTYVCLKNGLDYLVNIPYEKLLKYYLGDRKMISIFGQDSSIETGEDLDTDAQFGFIHEK